MLLYIRFFYYSYKMIIDTRIAAHDMKAYHSGAAVFLGGAKVADNSVSGM